MDFKIVNASKGFQATPINLMHISLDLKCVKNYLKHKEGVACAGACLNNTRLVFVRRRPLDDHPCPST
jgi:hypothetical protein